jgi:hypothetical protein
MRKSLAVIFFLAICWAGLSAQHFSHVVYLKNGWVIKGRVMLNTPDTLKIESCCGNIFVFNPSEVLTIETEKIKPGKESVVGHLISSKNGIYSLNTFGLIIGRSNAMDGTGYSLKTQIGYQFSNYAGIALGTGIDKYNIEVVPLFISFKSELMKRENTPVLNCYFGYSFPMKNKNTSDYTNYTYDGGFCSGFDIGICSYKTQSRAFYLSAGYQYQHLTAKSSTTGGWNNSITIDTYDFNKLVVKIGFLFK